MRSNLVTVASCSVAIAVLLSIVGCTGNQSQRLSDNESVQPSPVIAQSTSSQSPSKKIEEVSLAW
jgi:hypothetical protein